MEYVGYSSPGTVRVGRAALSNSYSRRVQRAGGVTRWMGGVVRHLLSHLGNLSVWQAYPAIMTLFVVLQYSLSHEGAVAHVARVRLLLDGNVDVFMHFERGQHREALAADRAVKWILARGCSGSMHHCNG